MEPGRIINPLLAVVISVAAGLWLWRADLPEGWSVHTVHDTKTGTSIDYTYGGPPVNPVSHSLVLLGHRLFLEQKFEAARDAFDRAIAADPANANAFLNRGNVRLKLRDYDGALADLNESLRLLPDCAATLVNRGHLYHQRGDSGRALQDLNRAIELDPRDAVAVLNRGFVFEDTGKPEEALRDYDRAIELDPKYAHAYVIRGRLRAIRGDVDGGEADLRTARRIDPQIAPHQ